MICTYCKEEIIAREMPFVDCTSFWHDSSNLKFGKKIICANCWEIMEISLMEYFRKADEQLIVEYGTDCGIACFTSDGIKKMEPGKVYDRNWEEKK